MRVGLIHPASPFLIDSAVHPPLGLWYLGAALAFAGHEVAYCDRGLGDELPNGCDVWGLTGTSAQTEDMAAIVAAAEVPVIVGGPHASADPESVLAMGATVAVCGEGEVALLALLRQPLVPGAVVTADRIDDLDAVLWPDRAQMHRYCYEIRDRAGRSHRATTAITSRGCPHRCAFCSKAVWGQRTTMRSADNVLGEMRNLREYGYRAVHFYDDSLALKRDRLMAICVGMGKLGMVWRAFVRADQVTAHVLAAMAAGGCVEVGIGVESGSQTILDNIDKGETVRQQRDAIRWARMAGLRVKTFVIVGLPGETWHTVDETVEFLASTQPDDLDVALLQAMPGAPLHNEPWRYGLTVCGGPSWYKGRPGAYQAQHGTEALSPDDLVAARDYLEARFKPRVAA